jgi:hypothetical protein
MHAMKSGTPGSGRSGFPSEKFREDPLRLGGNLAKRMTVRETDAFALLRKHLFALVHGEIAETGRVTALLAGCWHEFVGAESQRMHAGELGRMEDVHWEPPVLSFRVERHGAMGVGSTRAELQTWRVDLDRKIAKCERSRSYRQALPRAEGVRTEPIAGELAESIIAGRVLVGQLQRFRPEPLHAHNRDERIRQDAAHGCVGLEVFESAHVLRCPCFYFRMLPK